MYTILNNIGKICNKKACFYKNLIYFTKAFDDPFQENVILEFMKLKVQIIIALVLGILIPICLIMTIIVWGNPTLTELFIDFVLIMLLTCIILVSWMYTSVVAPIQNLTEATKKITEGTLEFEMETPEHNDEIAELCSNFDKMRQRLLDSANAQVEGENENRELISNITHDLKTPVTSIKGYAEGIMDGVADTPEKMDRYIRTIYTKANEIDSLINELTFYSGIDTNKIAYNFARINISDYFDDCVDEIKVDLESKNIELNYTNYLDRNICIIADPIQMKKVVNNIVGNSIKYIDKEKGVMNIRLRDADSSIIVEIEDNGQGIAAKDLPYIFDRFYRTDTSRNSIKGGSGIGLSIVKKIVEDHGGRVWAVSHAGTGTTMMMEFRKYLPAESEEAS